MAQRPIVNAGLKYCNGLEISRTSDEVVAIAAGACRDSNNVIDIVVDSALSVSNIVSGAGGLDTGTVANSTFYAVFVIADSTKHNDPVGLISASGTAPTLPEGYDSFRRIGWVKTDGTADFLEFRQYGAGQERWMWYDAPIATDITAGSSATYAAVDASGGLPDSNPRMVNWYCVFTPTGADDLLVLTPGTSTATLGYATMSGSAAGVVKTGNLICPTDSPNTDAIDYKVTGSATAISVAAYLDELV